MSATAEKVLFFESIPSTNAKAKELATHGEGLKTVVVAETQTAGRGRGARSWHSPMGGLYLSVLLQPREGRRPTDLSILAGVAVAQAVKDCLPKAKEVTVKWPNDCLVDWKKVGGILCETMSDRRIPLCIVGIGINVNVGPTDLSPFLANPFSATSFSIEAQGTHDLKECLDVVLKKLFTLYDLYHLEGFAPIRYLWEKNCRLIGKKVELKDSSEPGAEGCIGTFIGIDDDGGLVLSNAKGDRTAYFSGELTCFWP